MKAHTTISLDHEILAKARDLKLNLSKTINEYLKLRLSTNIDNVEHLDIILEKKKVKRLNKKLIELQTKIKESDSKINKWEEKKQTEEIKTLEKQKALISKSQTCQSCKSTILDKAHNFPIGKICNSCFMSAESTQIKLWKGGSENVAV